MKLLLSEDEPVDLDVSYIHKEQTIFYVTAGGSMEGVTVGPGTLSLRLRAKMVPGARGICDLTAQPVFMPPANRLLPQLTGGQGRGEYVFSSAGFGLEMGPDDFFFLGPEKYVSPQMALGGLFFSRPDNKPAPVAKVFIFVCMSVIE